MTLFDMGGPQHVPPTTAPHARADSDAQAASWFLGSNTMHEALAFDQHLRGRMADEIRLVISPGWRDLFRVSAALTRVEREVRRCAAAWESAYEGSSAEGDATVFDSPVRFTRELEVFPAPAHGSRGSVQVVASSTVADRTWILGEPRDQCFSVLSEWPASTLVYAAASLARPGSWRWHQDAPLDDGCWDSPSRHLSELRELSGGRTSHRREVRDWRQLKFRPVSDAIDDEDGSVRHGGLALRLHRALPDGRQDLFAVDLGQSQ